MDGIQVGLLGADRSDGAYIVLVSEAEDKNCVIAPQSVLQEKEEGREGKRAFEGYLKRGPFKTGVEDVGLSWQQSFPRRMAPCQVY